MDKNRKIVNEAVLAVCFAEEITGEEGRLREDYGIDSLSMVELIVQLEDGLGVVFSESDLDVSRFETVGDLYALADRYAAAAV